MELSRRQFEALVERALGGLPRRFRQRLANIAVVVEDWADEDTLDEVGAEELYGLYRGTDLTRRDSSYGGVLPDVITIYQGPIQEDCGSADEMEALVQDTVVHEIGHYFGMDDDQLAELEGEPGP